MSLQPYSLNDVMNEISSLKEMIVLMNDKPKTPIVKPDDELWTVKDVAGYLRKSKSTIQSHYQNRSDFPRSKKIGSTRYWKPKEVIAYANKREVH